MSFRAIRAAAAACVLLYLFGCATPPQTPVAMTASSVSGQGSRIGIAMTAMPTADTSFPGANCLLCLAAASIANSSLTAHVKTLTAEDLPSLKARIAELIRKRGAEPVVIEEALKPDDLPKSSAQGPNLARRDFSSVGKKHRLDKLLVIVISELGFERSYSAYFPTSDPKGVMRGSGSLIDLKSNVLEWYEPILIVKSADGAWDEPPKFPGLTNAYFQVLELGKDQLLTPFKP